ncbi:MAG: FadR family transcriptional regulator [Firmicutes bacterium HGW-Firmicutes-1]|jgi:DNA-binding FadR family transcriptional regulator|nr:MAG: FadR family transcriptional regulator [Firmicutes bacterium HGW-Firmicutes-1]
MQARNKQLGYMGGTKVYDKTILSEKVAESIRNTIIEKNMQPGDQLQNELDLTKELNISRSTLREAIKILASTNVVEVRRGRGTFVSENLGISKDPFGINFIEEKDLLSHFFEVRLLVEPQMAEFAAVRATEEEIKNIRIAYEKVKEAITKGENHTEADIEFHNQIAKSTHNPILQRVVPIINDGIIGGYAKTKDVPETAEMVLIQHKKIMNAIENREQDSARRNMREHILYGLEQSRKKI